MTFFVTACHKLQFDIPRNWVYNRPKSNLGETYVKYH